MEQFELIDVREEQDVKRSSETFIHSHHYNYSTDYFRSSLAYHPRRTVESYHHWSMPMTPNDAFQDVNRFPDNFQSMQELWDWHKPLIEAEEKFYGSSYVKISRGNDETDEVIITFLQILVTSDGTKCHLFT
jgi:hypothetical protein